MTEHSQVSSKLNESYELLFQEVFPNPGEIVSQAFNKEFTKVVLVTDGTLSELSLKACYEPSGGFTYV